MCIKENLYNKNLTNIKQLLIHDYSLDNAMLLCGYKEEEKELLEKKLKLFIISMNKEASKQNDVTINIL